MSAPRFPIIVGPTAGGKSALALGLALSWRRDAIPAEIITADAFQVYRGLDVGTAKPTRDELALVPHHLIDLVDPGTPFSASDWLRLATAAIDACRSRGVTPIVVGGTHLYVKLLLDGLFDGPGADEPLRDELRARDPASLREELERVDPLSAARLHPNDLRRTVRALEVYRLTGTPLSAQQRQWDSPRAAPDRLLVGLDWPADAVNRRINARVREMTARGLADEARSLFDRALLTLPDGSPNQAGQALGYKQLIAHFQGRCTLDEALERTKIETRRFAKNQRTWLKRLRTTPGSIWIDATSGTIDDWIPRVRAACAEPAP